uniref:dystrobrevin binding protein 1b isoform X1 n=1 Tax=Doryrhamphus excisus TaxID=161450 RepID=UPI0025AE9747|nr:dystrobrevin binding protein 1b isoform X1 [Doryrhamphus excisus]XP_057902861.1 dystrobrevin binding protein 1b isoform X1 [Doryrhamphus excisus]
MRKGPGDGTSRPRSKEERDPGARLSVLTSDDSSTSDSETDGVMKRSRGFSSSFSLEEDPQLQSNDEDSDEESEPKDQKHTELEKQDAIFGSSQPPRSGVLRPQELWFAMSQCLSFRWPPCLSLNRQGKTFTSDRLQSAGRKLSVSSSSANESPARSSPSPNRNLKKEKEDVRSKGTKSGPVAFRGISRSSPRLPSRQASDSALASMLLERETFLRIELSQEGEEGGETHYRAEWKLSERTKDLAEGVWISRSLRTMN